MKIEKQIYNRFNFKIWKGGNEERIGIYFMPVFMLKILKFNSEKEEFISWRIIFIYFAIEANFVFFCVLYQLYLHIIFNCNFLFIWYAYFNFLFD